MLLSHVQVSGRQGTPLSPPSVAPNPTPPKVGQSLANSAGLPLCFCLNRKEKHGIVTKGLTGFHARAKSSTMRLCWYHSKWSLAT
jgi:hypothetical protein